MAYLEPFEESMATIQTLTVALNADTAQFHAKMSKAGGGLKSLVAAVNPVTAAIAAVGAVGMKAFDELSAAIERASELVDTADKLSINTEDLAAMRYSAQQAGVGVDSLTKGLEQLQKRLGNGQSAEALERIGLSAEKLKTLALTESMLQIADSLREPRKRSNSHAAQRS
jgi:DNA uptake protein ComE-like DNA-binding protein